MNHNFKAQEKDYSCGATALRNCLIHFTGQDVSEKTIRKYCNTKQDGTDEDDLSDGAELFGFDVRQIKTKSINIFKRKIIKGLKNGKVFIISTEAHNHWIAVVEYSKRKVKIVDSDYQKYTDKSIVQYITMKELADTTFGYDKFDKEKYYYFLELDYLVE